MLLSPRDNPAYSVAPAYQLRPAISRRIGRLRVSWFVLGTLFGAIVGAGVIKLTDHHSAPDITAKTSEAPISPAAEEPPVATAPAPIAPSLAPATTPDVPVAAAPPLTPEKPALDLPATLTVKMQRNETLASLLASNSVPKDEVDEALAQLKTVYNVKRMTRGQVVTFTLEANPQRADKAELASLSLDESPLQSVSLTRRNDGSFTVKETKSPVTKGLTHAGGTIRSSLYQTAIDSGIPVKMVGEIIQAFSYDVDFARDIHPGDKLDVVFERMHNDKNVTTSVGQMEYASLILGGDLYTVYRYKSADGFTGFYNAKGESVRKALLKTPINGAHVTSSFGMRMHPLLGYSKMHKGIDFGAPTGTPIYAAGDGVIEEAGRKGGYGNYVRLRHNATYATAYGHASRIAKGIHPGVHVRQGQIIAYVGSTGQSTGPHLHYEILSGGTQINPTGVKFRTGQTLAGKDFAGFKKEVKQVEVALAASPRKVQVASLH